MPASRSRVAGEAVVLMLGDLVEDELAAYELVDEVSGLVSMEDGRFFAFCLPMNAAGGFVYAM